MFGTVVHDPLPGSYNSAEVQVGVVSYSPPVTRTVPSGSSVAVWFRRGVTMLPVAFQVPVCGSYSSAAASTSRFGPLPKPPATSTLPSGSSVAVWYLRPVTMFPVAVQVPLSGSYSAAEVKSSSMSGAEPPATSTLPSGSCVAVCPPRAMIRLPVAVQVRVTGSYSSADTAGGRGRPTRPGDPENKHLN